MPPSSEDREDRGAGTALDAGRTGHGARREDKGSFDGSPAKQRSNRREQYLPCRGERESASTLSADCQRFSPSTDAGVV